MSVEQAQEYLALELKEYIVQRAIADQVSTEAAEAHARRQRAALLPAGPRTPHHRFFSIVDEATDTTVGAAWLHVAEDSGPAFLYDIVIHPPHRRRGHAAAALEALVAVAGEAGCSELRLNVFGQNDAARRLYEKCGFRVASLHMGKNCTGS